MNIDKNTPWEDMTPGGTIYDAGNAREFKTGDWRSMRPEYIPEKCKQCGFAIQFALKMLFLLEKI